jgi:hypothetical protein
METHKSEQIAIVRNATIRGEVKLLKRGTVNSPSLFDLSGCSDRTMEAVKSIFGEPQHSLNGSLSTFSEPSK